MNTHADQVTGSESQSVVNTVSNSRNKPQSLSQIHDNRPAAVAQRKLQEMADGSAKVKQLRTLQAAADKSNQASHGGQPRFAVGGVVQRQVLIDHKPISASDIEKAREIIKNLNAVRNVRGMGIENFDVSLEHGDKLLNMLLTDLEPHNFDDVAGLISFLKDLNDSLMPPPRAPIESVISLPGYGPVRGKHDLTDQGLAEHVKELIARKDTGAINRLLLGIQKQRATPDAQLPAAPEGKEAELLSLNYLHSVQPSSAERETKQLPTKDKKPVPTGTQLPKVARAFAGAQDSTRHVQETSVGSEQEQIVLDGLRLATKNLLFFMESKASEVGGYPSLDSLNSKEDLQSGRDSIISRSTDLTEDDYDHVFEIVCKGQDVEGFEARKARVDAVGEKAVALLRDRQKIRVEKVANTWLKYATPYVELKVDLYEGWPENEKGSEEQRRLYYLLKRTPRMAEDEIAGDSDVQAAITEPVSGKVALAVALREVYDSAACHDDAIQFVKLLGATTTAKGTLQENQRGVEMLTPIRLAILQHLEAGEAPIMGVRLRESGNHSLVLLFERLDEAGLLMGAKYETVAGRNSERILFLMDRSRPLPLTAAQQLIKDGLSKAVQIAREGWKLEWEVFEVKAPDALQGTIESHLTSTLAGVGRGLDRHKKGEEKLADLMGATEEEMYEEATEHTERVRSGKEAYLAEKERREQIEREKREKREEDVSAEKDKAKEALTAAKASGDGEIQRVLRVIYSRLGETAMYIIAGECGIRSERVTELVPDLV